MAAEGVLVLEHGAAHVTHAGLLLVGRDDVALGAQLGAVRADQLPLVAVLHVLVEVALAVEHLAAVLAGPVVLALLGVIIPHVSREVPGNEKDKSIHQNISCFFLLLFPHVFNHLNFLFSHKLFSYLIKLV